ncbi:MAG: hypothetical protein NZ772_08305 [Cyanobacteria bacterium]|nr:hypothetical protein [Cyanobacteriota bacterium]MDW8201467.1 hypothetical protein [Cyanobacteriota bacterium SKYGB_h_bin112]
MNRSLESSFTDRVAWLTSACPVARSDRHLYEESIEDYVAQLQLHMALQARNLVPTLNQEAVSTDLESRCQLLHRTQADAERLVSRCAV